MNTQKIQLLCVCVEYTRKDLEIYIFRFFYSNIFLFSLDIFLPRTRRVIAALFLTRKVLKLSNIQSRQTKRYTYLVTAI